MLCIVEILLHVNIFKSLNENVRNIFSIALIYPSNSYQYKIHLRVTSNYFAAHLRKYLYKVRQTLVILRFYDLNSIYIISTTELEKQTNIRKVLKVRLPRAISHSREHYLDGNCGSSIHRGQQISAKRAETAQRKFINCEPQ